MSDDDKDKSKSITDDAHAPQASTLSIAPAMDLSLDAVTVPPPPASLGGLNIPRAPALPKESRPGAAAPKKKRSEDDIFSVFDVESNTASDDIPVSVQTPAPAPAKPKTQLGNRSEEREQTRSKQFKIDDDLFNMSASLFSTSGQAPLVAPDMSALTAGGLSEKPAGKTSSSLDDLALPVAPIAPLAPVDTAALTAAPGQSSDEPKKSGGKTGLIVGAVAALALAAGVFVFFNKDASAPEATASADKTAATPEANNLDTLPAKTETPAPKAAATEAPKDAPAAAATNSPEPTAAAAQASDKPTSKTASADKPATGDKPSAGQATDKPAEPDKPADPPKTTQSLAEAMAAGVAGGSAPATPPPSSGPEFNKSAAQSALSGAAGAASGCKAPGDPSGTARVSVTFAPSGRATRAVVNGPPFAGTSTGQCVANAFRGVSVPPFSGSPVTVSKSVSIR